uniref:Uncharacterized protein n=1 Tax=uncultured Nitrospirota bacterium TaxID=170969 RepID=A0A142BTU0_9BACT|nr:hypothetical protein [uncultured Nitrospirota bacterium]
MYTNVTQCQICCQNLIDRPVIKNGIITAEKILKFYRGEIEYLAK